MITVGDISRVLAGEAVRIQTSLLEKVQIAQKKALTAEILTLTAEPIEITAMRWDDKKKEAYFLIRKAAPVQFIDNRGNLI